MDTEQIFRVAFIFIFLGSMTISASFRREARKSGETIARREESGLLIGMRLVFALPLFLSVLAYMINPDWLAWSALPLPIWIRFIGVVMGLACLPLLWWVFNSIGNNISETVLTKTDHALVTHGPYRWIRHPLYSVATWMFVSCGIISSSAWITGFALVALVMIVGYVIPREEKALTEKFGNAYVEYQSRSGRLIPKIGGGG